MNGRFDERAKQRIEQLIELGEKVKASIRRTPSGSTVLDLTLYKQSTTSSLTFLAAALGEDSAHYRAFVDIGQVGGHPVNKVDEYLGVLRAARDDIHSGWVGRRDLLLTANAFEGFLEQAEYLLSQNYKDAAAVLVGGVLEATLRKMCEVRGITIDKGDKIGTLNDKLAKHHKPPAYSAMHHKQIIAWADLRNNADHGHFGEYEPEHVRAMITGVREFAARHLA